MQQDAVPEGSRGGCRSLAGGLARSESADGQQHTGYKEHGQEN